MRNNVKIRLLMLVLILSTCLLSGCQLARDTASIKQATESLCGVFVTINDDMNYSLSNHEIKVNSKGELEFIDLSSSQTIEGVMEDGHVTFGDTPGYYMGLVEIDLNNSMNNCSGTDIGFRDTKYFVNSTDGMEEHSHEATITISRKTDKIIKMNPVYVRSDGSIYTILEQNGGYVYTGSSGAQMYTQTLSDEKSTTQGSMVKKEKKAFIIHVAMVDEAKHVLIKEMNREDSLIKTTIFTQTDAEDFIVDSNTSYVIVEELMTDNNDKDYIARSVYSLEDKDLTEEYISHTCSFPVENGIIGVKNIRFISKSQ